MKFIGTITVGILLIILRGFVLMQLWAWFVVPLFPGAPLLSIPAAQGLTLILSLMTGTVSSLAKREGDDSPTLWVAKSLAVSLVPLFIGWVFSLFM